LNLLTLLFGSNGSVSKNQILQSVISFPFLFYTRFTKKGIGPYQRVH
jgi:hypothetical protein